MANVEMFMSKRHRGPTVLFRVLLLPLERLITVRIYTGETSSWSNCLSPLFNAHATLAWHF